MAKYFGKIGFGYDRELYPDVYEKEIVEKTYRGDLLRIYRSNHGTDKINDDISLSNQISIIADPYAKKNIYAMLYATFMGTKWKIVNVDVQFPRIILSLGGIYNE